MSDGSNLWRALVSRKQWTKVSAASLEDARGEEESANPSAKDLHDVLEGLLLYHFMALAKTARDAAIAKEKEALSENLTDRPLLRNFLHPLNREEPTLVTAIRLAR